MFTEDSRLLIDADSLYFRVAMVTQKQNEIRKGIDRSLQNIRRQCLSDQMFIAVKGRGNFRNDIYPKYKANRAELTPRIKEALNYAHSYMVDKHGAIQSDGMEADDLVSIWAYESMDIDAEYTIVGIDKDLLQIPGNHYNFAKQEHLFQETDKANYCLMRQCLTGDSTDNIPGIKGIGPKKAQGILQGVPISRRWNRVKAAWRGHKAGNPDLSRRLLEMLTSWEEYEELRNKIESKTSKRQPDVLEGQESKD